MLGWDSVSEMIQGGGKKQTIQINKNKKPHPPKNQGNKQKSHNTHPCLGDFFSPGILQAENKTTDQFSLPSLRHN